MTLILVVAVAVAIFAALASFAGASNAGQLSSAPDPAELASTDPVEALLRYGVSEDYDRAGEQGVDLRDLGYDPPEEG